MQGTLSPPGFAVAKKEKEHLTVKVEENLHNAIRRIALFRRQEIHVYLAEILWPIIRQEILRVNAEEARQMADMESYDKAPPKPRKKD